MPTCCQLVMLTCCNAGAKLACWHWHAERLKSGHAAALTCWHARPQCGLQSWLPSHVFSCCRVVVVAHMWPHVLCRLIAILVRPQWHIGKGHACLKQRNLPKTKPLAKYMDGSCCLNTWSGDASHRCHQLQRLQNSAVGPAGHHLWCCAGQRRRNQLSMCSSVLSPAEFHVGSKVGFLPTMH